MRSANDVCGEDRRFDASLNSVLHMDKKDYPCYVGGLKVASGNVHIVKSPVDTSIQFGKFQESDEDLPDIAVDAAKKVFREWSKTERTGIFEKALETMRKQRYRIAAAITLSAGMTRSDSLYEVDRLTEITEDGIKKIREGVKGMPMGVFAVISEYNSPLAAPMGYAVSAMLAGNTVVLIPPKECPFPVYMLYNILTSSGLPDGVLNVIFDRRGKAAKRLTENGEIAGIAAAGRGDRFEDLMFAAVNEEISFIGEFKGMNPLVIFKPASMRDAADMTINSAFRYAGQRMDSCSKVIVTIGEQKQFMDNLLASAKKITVGDPSEKDTFAGPVISEDSMQTFLDIVQNAKDNLIFGGKRISDGSGFYVMPAIFAGLPQDHELNEIDHSLPVLSVQLANDISEAIEMAAGCEYGSGIGIISKDEKVIDKFLSEAVCDTYVNISSGIAVKADVSGFLRK